MQQGCYFVRRRLVGKRHISLLQLFEDRIRQRPGTTADTGSCECQAYAAIAATYILDVSLQSLTALLGTV